MHIASGYEIPDEAAGTLRLTLGSGAADPVPVRDYDLRHRLVGASVWTDVLATPAILDLLYATGDEIELQPRATSWGGVTGPWGDLRTYTVLPQTIPGPVIASLIVDRLATGVRRYSWSFVEPPGPRAEDQVGVYLRYRAGSWASWTILCPPACRQDRRQPVGKFRTVRRRPLHIRRRRRRLLRQ